jgi:alpha-ketoglutarate-dependent 2,4-dichlorophenoxyacetate dioxygenase
MALSVKQLHPLFAAEVRGLEIARPVEAATAREIDAIMAEYAVAILPGQFIDDEQQIRFTRNFGTCELAPEIQGVEGWDAARVRIRHREIFDAGNLDQYGNVLTGDAAKRAYSLANRLWHTDSSFRQVSATYSMLSARVVPPAGADTEFADTRAAYDDLPAAMKKKLEGLIAEHSIWTSKGKLGGYRPSEEELRTRLPAHHPVVRRHPGSGRKALFVASHASHIVGMPLAEGQALIAELIAHATRPRYVYSHRWSAGDLVIWDNRCTMHRATPFEDKLHPRDARRTTVREAVPATA